MKWPLALTTGCTGSHYEDIWRRRTDVLPELADHLKATPDWNLDTPIYNVRAMDHSLMAWYSQKGVSGTALSNVGVVMNQQTVVRPLAPKSVEELENRLQASLSGRVRNLRILLHGSGIVVRGFAHTYYAKQIAQHVIMRETTIPILANDIEVY
jgi:hypothetical protein